MTHEQEQKIEEILRKSEYNISVNCFQKATTISGKKVVMTDMCLSRIFVEEDKMSKSVEITNDLFIEGVVYNRDKFIDEFSVAFNQNEAVANEIREVLKGML